MHGEPTGTMPQVSVVICTFNRAHVLEGALEALRRQRTAPDLAWEIIVVDNNSTDTTERLVNAFKAAAPVPVTYVFEPEQGLSVARNTGVRHARGSIVAFTDDDCRPEPTWVHDLTLSFARWNADGIGGRILPAWSSSPPPWLASDLHLWTRLALLADAEPRIVSLGPWQREHGFRIWGAHMAFRRRVLQAAGGFDLAMGPRGGKHYSHEDIDFVRRALLSGNRLVYDPAPTVLHYVGPDRFAKSYFRRHALGYGEGSAIRNGLRTRYHLLGIPPYLLRALLGHLAIWLQATLKRDPDTFCSQLEVWEDLGYLVGYVKCALGTGRYFSLGRG